MVTRKQNTNSKSTSFNVLEYSILGFNILHNHLCMYTLKLQAFVFNVSNNKYRLKPIPYKLFSNFFCCLLTFVTKACS